MDRHSPPPAIFPSDNDNTKPTDTDIMREYAIDILFASEYHTGDTEEIETVDALKAPDSAQFITAILIARATLATPSHSTALLAPFITAASSKQLSPPLQLMRKRAQYSPFPKKLTSVRSFASPLNYPPS